MDYLAADEYTEYGLEDSTAESLVQAASRLIDAHCHRQGLDIRQYVERFRVGFNCIVRLTYLPLAAATGATSAIVDVRGRYARRNWRGGGNALAAEIATVFVTPNVWVEVPASALDIDANSGEVLVGIGPLSPSLSDLEITYTAGYSTIPAVVKTACARLVRNAQATPALNVQKQKIDNMYLQYFADTLLDEDVKRMLAPFVAQRFAS